MYTMKEGIEISSS